MIILGLDLAICSGFCVGPVGGEPRYGSIEFAPRGSQMVEHFRALEKWLLMFVAQHDPALVIYEAPIPTQKRTTLQTLRILYGMGAVVEFTLDRIGRECEEADVSVIRRHFIGKYRKGEAKTATIAACRRLDFWPHDDNAADAIAVWHYKCCLIRPELAIQCSPLFRRRRKSKFTEAAE